MTLKKNVNNAHFLEMRSFSLPAKKKTVTSEPKTATGYRQSTKMCLIITQPSHDFVPSFCAHSGNLLNSLCTQSHTTRL